MSEIESKSSSEIIGASGRALRTFQGTSCTDTIGTNKNAGVCIEEKTGCKCRLKQSTTNKIYVALISQILCFNIGVNFYY